MSKGNTLIELKHYGSFDLIEPWFVKDCHENIQKFYQVYYSILNGITSIKENAQGAMLLKGQDLLFERMLGLEENVREITDICDNIHNMKLYDIATKKRSEILSRQRTNIERKKQRAEEDREYARKSRAKLGALDPMYEFFSLQIQDSYKIIDQCNEDLEIIARLEVRDDNEY